MHFQHYFLKIIVIALLITPFLFNTVEANALTIIATCQDNINAGNFTSRAVLPNTTASNGTIRVKTDRLFFASSAYVKWINVSFDGSYTNYSNTPLFVDPTGHNVTINASRPITITRETQFQQEKQFYWTKYADSNQYTATVQITNPLVPIETMKEVYIYMEFANDTTPDYVTTKLYDVTNGVYVTKGQNFQADATGIQFLINSLSNNTRSFTASYSSNAKSKIPSDAIINANAYELVNHKGLNYWHTKVQWINTRTDNFIGPIYISFNFTSDYQIAPNSVDVTDSYNGVNLTKNQFSFYTSGLIISQEAVGNVPSNGGRIYDIYWLFIGQEGNNSVVQMNILHTPILSSVPVIGEMQIFHALLLLLFGLILGALFSKDGWKKYKIIITMCFVFIVGIVYIY